MIYEFDYEVEVGEQFSAVALVPIGKRDMECLLSMEWCEAGEYSKCTQWQIAEDRSGGILVVPVAPDISSPYDHPFWEVYNSEFSTIVERLSNDEYHMTK